MGASPQMVDWDEDGDVDLIAGESDGHIHYFENIGTVTNPQLIDRGHLTAGGVAIDVTSLAIPVVQDWNEDGKKDLIVGNDPAYIRIYLNVGTNENPQFNSCSYMSTYPSITQIKNAPDIGDLNGDGLKDLAFGWWQGTVIFYPNSGTNASPLLMSSHELTALGTVIDPGGWTHMEFNDWDEDGDLDLVYGEWYGDVYLHLNLSSEMIAEAEPQNPPIQIPASGGSFQFQGTLTNNTTHNLNVDVWTIAKLPSGQSTPTLFQAAITLPAGASVSRVRVQNVPASAPAGEYEYFLRWGIYPDQAWAEDSFTFEKLATDNGGNLVLSWDNSGEPFNDESSADTHHSSFIIHHSVSPNPFNPTTTIAYELKEATSVKLAVFDINGREVANLVDGWMSEGIHTAVFNAENLASGIYFYHLSAGDFRAARKMILMK